MHLRKKVSAPKKRRYLQKMKLQEYLLVLFCTIAVTIAASVVSRQEGSIAESAQLSSSTSNVVAGSRVTREADDDEDAGKLM